MSVTLKKKSMRSKSQRKTKLMKRNLKLNKTRKMRGGGNGPHKQPGMKVKRKLGQGGLLNFRSRSVSITPAQAPKTPAPVAQYAAAKNLLTKSQSSSSFVSSSGSSPPSSPRSSPPSSPRSSQPSSPSSLQQSFSKNIQSTAVEPRFVTRVGPNGETFVVPRERVGASQVGNEERFYKASNLAAQRRRNAASNTSVTISTEARASGFKNRHLYDAAVLAALQRQAQELIPLPGDNKLIREIGKFKPAQIITPTTQSLTATRTPEDEAKVQAYLARISAEEASAK